MARKETPMALNTKVQIDNVTLLKKMETLQNVTGKQVAATLRRGARLLAVNIATSTPPYGMNSKSLQLGERAVQNDVLKVMTPLYPIILAYPTSEKSFIEQISSLKSRSLVKAMSQAHSAESLQAIFNNAGQFSRLTANSNASAAQEVYHSARNSQGRVRKGWRSRNIITDPGSVATFIKAKQALVGMTKAAWASCAIKVNAPVKNAAAGIPAWVKRHLDAVPCAVNDSSESILPEIKLTSKIPWADKALGKGDYNEAVRITKEKFFNSMNREIRAALKAQAVVGETA